MQLEDLKESHLESVFLSFTSFSIHDDNWSSQIQSSLCGLVKHYIESKGCCSSSNPWGCIQSRSYSRMNFTHVPTSCLTERCIENLSRLHRAVEQRQNVPKASKTTNCGRSEKMWTASFLPHHNSQYYPPTISNGFELAKMTGDTDYRCVGNDNPTCKVLLQNIIFNVSVFCLYCKLIYFSRQKRREVSCMIDDCCMILTQSRLFCKLKTLVVSHHTFVVF